MTHNPTKDAIFLPAPAEPAVPLVLNLPPFTGTNSRCAKCRFSEAYTWYRPATTRVFTEWNDRQQIRGPLPERLERQCQRCDFQWEEALVPSGGCAPAARGDEGGQDAQEADLHDVVRALDDSSPYPVELHPDALTFIASQLLERLRISRRREHPLWQPEEVAPAATPAPAPAPAAVTKQPPTAVVPIPLGHRQPATPAGPTAYAQAAEG